MRKTILNLLPVLALFSILLTACQSSQKASSSQVMKFNLEKGKVYDYDMAFDIDQGMPGGQQMKMNMKSAYILEVTDEDNGVKTIKTTFGPIVMDMTGVGPNGMRVDTNNPDTTSGEGPKMMNKVLKSLVGQSFTMKVNPEGKVLEFSGFDAIRKSMVSSLGLEGEEAQGAQLMSGQVMNDDNLRKSFEQAFFIFPNKEVKVGDTWTKNMEMGGIMPFKVTSNYTVKSIEGDHATLSMLGTISSTLESLKMEGTQNGTLIVELKSGLVVNSDFNQDFTSTTPGGTMSAKSKGHIKGKAR